MSRLAEAPKLHSPERPINLALEQYLIGQNVVNEAIDPNGLFVFDHLPVGLISGEIHTYSRSLYDLSHSRPTPAGEIEFGAWVHLELNRRILLYPEEPTTGEKDRVTPAFLQNKDVFPVAMTHSHPGINDFLSPTDMWVMIGNLHKPVPVVGIAATKDDSYLMLRTQETQPQSLETMHGYILEELYFPLSVAAQAFAQNLERKIPLNDRVAMADTQLFPGGRAFYHQQVMTIVALAEKFKVGLYYTSHPNNHYYRLNANSAITMLSSRAQKLLDLSQSK